MIKKTRVKFVDGSEKTQIRVVKSVRSGPENKPKQITVRSFGYLEDQCDLEAFWASVKEVNENMLEIRKKNVVVSIPTQASNNADMNKTWNYGYRFVEAALEALKIKEFFEGIHFRGDYSLYDVFEFLVIQRILNPSSKRESCRQIDRFYNKRYDFTLTDIYRALSKFSEHSVALQTFMNKEISSLIGRENSYAFYDVTNYYFEKDFNGPAGTYQQKGVSKEHQLTPIVQFGLFMDSNNIPIAMKTYPGNTSDSLTLQPAMKDVKKDFKLGRLIVVADKGLNSSSNIDYICNGGDGYVVSQVLRGKKGSRYHEIMFDPNGYEGNDDFKYKLFEEDYEGKINSKKKVTRRRKVLIYWSKEDAAYARRKRNEKLQKAIKGLNNNAYGIDHSKTEYVVSQYLNSETGEVADEKISGIDYDKIAQEEKFDGYFCIITSELNYDCQKILSVYRNLWHIEESFRITKSDLCARPIYVSTDDHIDGHFLICFVALTVIRLLQHKMGELRIPAQRIQRVLSACQCKIPAEDVVWLDEVCKGYEYEQGTGDNGSASFKLKLDTNSDYVRNDWLLLQKTFGIDIDSVVLERTVFDKRLKAVSYPRLNRKRRTMTR